MNGFDFVYQYFGEDNICFSLTLLNSLIHKCKDLSKHSKAYQKMFIDIVNNTRVMRFNILLYYNDMLSRSLSVPSNNIRDYEFDLFKYLSE